MSVQYGSVHRYIVSHSNVPVYSWYEHTYWLGLRKTIEKLTVQMCHASIACPNLTWTKAYFTFRMLRKDDAAVLNQLWVSATFSHIVYF